MNNIITGVCLSMVSMAVGAFIGPSEHPCSKFCVNGETIVMTRAQVQKIEALLEAAHVQLGKSEAELHLCKIKQGCS